MLKYLILLLISCNSFAINIANPPSHNAKRKLDFGEGTLEQPKKTPLEQLLENSYPNLRLEASLIEHLESFCLNSSLEACKLILDNFTPQEESSHTNSKKRKKSNAKGPTLKKKKIDEVPTSKDEEINDETLPAGVRIYQLPIPDVDSFARSSAMTESEQDKAKGNFYVSPSQPNRGVIYNHFVVNRYQDNYIDKKDRINIQDVFIELNLKEDDLSQETNLFKLLLAVEIRIRTAFKNNEDALYGIIYTGLAKNFVHRSYSHGRDVIHGLDQKAQSKKVNYECRVLADKNIRMSYFIEGIPILSTSTDYLKLFEVLMSRLTFSFDFGANSEIGDNKAWLQINEYWQWEERVKALTKAGFDFEIEKSRQELQLSIICNPKKKNAELLLNSPDISDDSEVTESESGSESDIGNLLLEHKECSSSDDT